MRTVKRNAGAFWSDHWPNRQSNHATLRFQISLLLPPYLVGDQIPPIVRLFPELPAGILFSWATPSRQVAKSGEVVFPWLVESLLRWWHAMCLTLRIRGEQ